MSKLDDLLSKKKEIVPVLDLSKTILHSKEDYKRLLEKVPDFKMRPIKVCLFLYTPAEIHTLIYLTICL